LISTSWQGRDDDHNDRTKGEMMFRSTGDLLKWMRGSRKPAPVETWPLGPTPTPPIVLRVAADFTTGHVTFEIEGALKLSLPIDLASKVHAEFGAAIFALTKAEEVDLTAEIDGKESSE
jgi:hypothetical protein